MILIIIILGFLCVFLLSLSFFENKSEKIIADRVKSSIDIVSLELKKINKPKNFYDRIIIPLIKKLAKINSGIKSINDIRIKYKNKLLLADISELYSPDEFIALKELSFFTVFIIYPLVISFDIFYMLVFGVLAFFLPDLWLKEKIETKRRAILRALPDTLDLLTACVEAGLTFDAALNKVVDKGKDGALKTEFTRMLYEIKIGKSRKDALKDTAKRIQLTDFSSFARSIIQSEKLGISIGKTLRSLSDELRIKRRQRAEKLAMEAPVKLLFPLLAFIFPTVFIMLFGPIIIRLISTFR